MLDLREWRVKDDYKGFELALSEASKSAEKQATEEDDRAGFDHGQWRGPLQKNVSKQAVAKLTQETKGVPVLIVIKTFQEKTLSLHKISGRRIVGRYTLGFPLSLSPGIRAPCTIPIHKSVGRSSNLFVTNREVWQCSR